MDVRQSIISAPFTVAVIQIKARQLSRRADFSISDFDDLCQDMRMYLWRKAHRFNPDRGSLEAFVNNALDTWVTIELRYRKRLRRSESYRAVSLEGTLVKYEGELQPLGDVVLEEEGGRRIQTYPISPFEEFERREAIEHVMAKLAPEDRAFVNSLVERGIRATAKSLGITWYRVIRMLALIRRDFEKNGLGSN
ncbi:MAG: hypothetical protein FWD61_07600 [Phycisphaerales bacterium]|nr:hypothetical protein [Phycisphaerales bacterium]